MEEYAASDVCGVTKEPAAGRRRYMYIVHAPIMPKLYGDLGMIAMKKHGMRIMKSKKKKTNKRRVKRHGSKLRMKEGSAEGSALWIQVRLILLKQGRKDPWDSDFKGQPGNSVTRSINKGQRCEKGKM